MKERKQTEELIKVKERVMRMSERVKESSRSRTTNSMNKEYLYRDQDAGCVERMESKKEKDV